MGDAPARARSQGCAPLTTSAVSADDRYIHPQQEAFSIQLISPVSWEAIPNARIELEEWEHVTCMKTVSLRSEETVSGLKGYVAAGTCLMQGEEVTCRGRVSGGGGGGARAGPAMAARAVPTSSAPSPPTDSDHGRDRGGA